MFHYPVDAYAARHEENVQRRGLAEGDGRHDGQPRLALNGSRASATRNIDVFVILAKNS